MINFCSPDREGKRDILVNLCPPFRQIGGGQKAYPIFASFQLPSAQNNLHIKVAYLGVANSATIHRQQREKIFPEAEEEVIKL